jgi:hypothetical protein
MAAKKKAKKAASKKPAKKSKAKAVRCCGRCRKPGHNSRTCNGKA